MHARYRSLQGQMNWLDAFLDSLNWLQVEHRSSVATNSPDVLQRQLLQQLVMERL